jgi:hypothetical protein
VQIAAQRSSQTLEAAIDGSFDVRRKVHRRDYAKRRERRKDPLA